MGTIYTRGTRSKPRYYIHFREGSHPDGSPRYVQRAVKGARTKSEAGKELSRIETAIGQGIAWDVSTKVVAAVGPLMIEWRDGLRNRSAYQDRLTVTNDLLPEFEALTLDGLTLALVMRYLDKLAATTMASQTQRHRLTLLSRFFSWAIERGLAQVNPCRMIPRGKRPSARRSTDVPFLDDDSKIPAIMSGLGPSLGLIYYLSRFSGLREGEAAGLRMSDLAFLAEDLIRVRYSFDGPLKESKDGSKPVKWAPAPIDVVEVLGIHLKRRRLQGARDEDLVFPYDRPTSGHRGRARTSSWATWAGYHPKQIRAVWRKVANSLGLPKELTFYGSSRHSYATKGLTAGASLDEVSAVLGHADPSTTKRSYDHLVRRSFAPILRQGLNSVPAAPTDENASADRSGGKGDLPSKRPA